MLGICEGTTVYAFSPVCWELVALKFFEVYVLERLFCQKINSYNYLTAHTFALLVFTAPSPAHTLHRLYLFPGPLCRGVCTWEGDQETGRAPSWCVCCAFLVCVRQGGVSGAAVLTASSNQYLPSVLSRENLSPQVSVCSS